MTRSLAPSRRRRITQPIAIVHRRRDPAIHALGFQCYRLVPTGDAAEPYVALEVVRGGSRMFALVRACA
jgi:hypothetical protein